jgi:hypothetical protein
VAQVDGGSRVSLFIPGEDGVKTYYMPFHNAYGLVKVDEAKGERWFCTEGAAIAAGWQRVVR